MMKLPISVTILTKNSERFICEVLDALTLFDEVVIVDNGSTDRTLELVKAYENVNMYIEEFIGFGPLKGQATKLAKHDWIFSIDSDEIVGEDLLENIKNLDLSKSEMIYTINRRNYFCGVEIKHSGWAPDILIRIFNKKSTNFDESYVHEKVLLPESYTLEHIKGSFVHYSMPNIEDIVNKMNTYSAMYAQKNLHKRTNASRAFLGGAFAFFKSFILKRGFLDGWRGLVIAVMAANGSFFKYIKILDLQEKR
jgi:glycosyltransferase involved in cell wall biosynthesis